MYNIYIKKPFEDVRVKQHQYISKSMISLSVSTVK